MSFRVVPIVLVLALLVALAACGKKGPLELPPDDPAATPATP